MDIFQDESRVGQRSVLSRILGQEEYPTADGARSLLWKLLLVQFHLTRYRLPRLPCLRQGEHQTNEPSIATE